MTLGPPQRALTSAISESIARQVLQAPTKRHQARIRQPKQEQVERVTNVVSSLVANLAVMRQDHLSAGV